MKKVGLFLILTFITYLIGQLIWIISFYSGEPLFGSEYLETMVLIQIYNSSGILGLISGIMLYKLEI